MCFHLDTRVKSAYKVSSVYCIKCKLHWRTQCPRTIRLTFCNYFNNCCALFSNNCIVKAFGWFLVFALSICFLSDSFPWVHTEWEHERNSTILYANISCLFYLHCVNCMKVLILIFTNAYIALNLLFTKRIYFCLLRNDISFQRKYENGQKVYSFNFML